VTACPCQFCNRPLEPAQELRFLVETDTLDNPTHLDRIRRLPFAADGKPLRVCKTCQSHIETNPVRFRAAIEARVRRRVHTNMLTAVGLLSAGWFLGLLLGPARV
jgi:hypothetical protein